MLGSLGWLLAAALAVTVGVVAVTTVGASMRGRGPLGNEVVRERRCRSGPPRSIRGPAPGRAHVPRRVRRARRRLPGRSTRSASTPVPTSAAGWRVVSYETGPDDDIDAVFANKDRSIEIEVYCNRGEPTIGDLERNTLPEGDVSGPAPVRNSGPHG